MPPFQRKTLVLIGAQGVGRRSLKNRLIVVNPLRYGTTVPCESININTMNINTQLSCYFTNKHSHSLGISFVSQLLLGIHVTMKRTSSRTALFPERRWTWTSRQVDTWSTESMMAICTVPKLTPSMKSCAQDVLAYWTSTHRSVVL